MWVDQDGAEVLQRTEALRLLALHAGGIGRVGLIIDKLPVILPVNYALAEDYIVFRSATGAKTRAALENQLVAFEVDGIDTRHALAWSVLVRGLATLAGKAELEHSHLADDLFPVVPDPGFHHILVRPDVVTARRFSLPKDKVEELVSIWSR